MSVETRSQLAVALHYDKKGAPRVVAKGRGSIGEKIIELAKAHDIPIEENDVLAGALSKVELGDEIPDLYFDVQLLISDPPYIASRLGFDCTPKGKFLSLHVNGKRVSFTENVFYEFRREKIEQVWSVIDKAAIEAQL